MSAPEPTAGEHTAACHEAAWDEGWRCICPATPDADDASTEASDADRVLSITDRIYAEVTSASAEASEGLTEAERVVLLVSAGKFEGDPCIPGLLIAVEGIVAAREAKARADERERIAQAIEARESFAHGKNNASEAHLLGFGTMRRIAARIARGDA